MSAEPTASDPPRATSANAVPIRDATIDVARGVAIIAIVLGHVQRGVVRAGLLPADEPWFLVSDTMLWLVHLSVFALLSGLFVARGAQRDGTGVYLRRRVVTFLWLYVVWCLLQGFLSVALSSVVNRPRPWWDVLALWTPSDQFWFLPWLAVVTVAVVLARPWASAIRLWATVIGGIAVSVACWGLGWYFIGTQGLGLTGFFAIGVAIGGRRFTRWSSATRWPVALAAAIALAVPFTAIVLGTTVTTPTEGGFDRTVVSTAAGIAASVLGTVALLAVSRVLATTGALARVLAFLGRRSLEIFLAHVLAGAFVRIALSAVGVENPVVHIVVGTLGGVALPLIAWWVLERMRFPWLFAAPRLLTGEPRGESPAPPRTVRA